MQKRHKLLRRTILLRRRSQPRDLRLVTRVILRLVRVNAFVAIKQFTVEETRQRRCSAQRLRCMRHTVVVNLHLQARTVKALRHRAVALTKRQRGSHFFCGHVAHLCGRRTLISSWSLRRLIVVLVTIGGCLSCRRRCGPAGVNDLHSGGARPSQSRVQKQCRLRFVENRTRKISSERVLLLQELVVIGRRVRRRICQRNYLSVVDGVVEWRSDAVDVIVSQSRSSCVVGVSLSRRRECRFDRGLISHVLEITY